MGKKTKDQEEGAGEVEERRLGREGAARGRHEGSSAPGEEGTDDGKIEVGRGEWSGVEIARLGDSGALGVVGETKIEERELEGGRGRDEKKNG